MRILGARQRRPKAVITVALCAAVTSQVSLPVPHALAQTDYGSHRHVVMPGGELGVPDKNHPCVAGFLLRDDRGGVYVVTSGKCGPDESPPQGGSPNQLAWHPFTGKRTWTVGDGPGVRGIAPYYRNVGQFVAQVVSADLDGPDFGVVRLDPGIGYDATVPVVGGPAGLYRGATSDPTQVSYVCPDGPYGYYGLPIVGSGPVYNDGVVHDVALSGIKKDVFRVARSYNTCGSGGSPVVGLDGNQALGIIVESAYAVGYDPGPAGPTGGTLVNRLDMALSGAQSLLHLHLTLLTAGHKGVTRK